MSLLRHTLTGASGGTNLEPYWMPFTDNRRFKSNPNFLAAAEGMYYFTPDGARVLDGTAGLWCVNAGHCRPRIVDAVQKQVAKLDYAPSFQIGHPLAFACAEELLKLFPAEFNNVFFANSGSEAVDSALKIALAYHRANGQGARTRFIGRERAYHGVGFGGLSVGGIPANRRSFIQLPGVDHLPHTYDPENTAFTAGQPRRDDRFAGALEAIIALHGSENIAAVIVEPMAGSTGVLVPPVGYLERLREITAANGILLIFDEVITAFGRLGAGTAAEYFGVIPDIITCAKGLTNGTVPMGAAVVKKDIYDTVTALNRPGIEFFHGYTYSGHPLAAAASLATLEIYAEEGLFARARDLSGYWAKAVHALKGRPHIIDIRSIGLVAGIELAPRKNDPGGRGMELFQRCLDAGLLIRITGDIVALSPPLIVEMEHIDAMVETIAKQLGHIA